jgi:hypothetical protein
MLTGWNLGDLLCFHGLGMLNFCLMMFRSFVRSCHLGGVVWCTCLLRIQGLDDGSGQQEIGLSDYLNVLLLAPARVGSA